MTVIFEFKILFYLIFILGISLLPLYLYRRSWQETGLVACFIMYFFILNRELLTGQLGAFHDTRMSYEYMLMIFKQWLDNGIAVGWNPYMNAGEPLYLFSNFFLWASWIIFCFLNRIVSLNAHILFNLYWVFLFVNFCTGSLVLFLVLYDNFKAALFCFITLLISGMFIVNLGQPAGLSVIYYFPHILTCLILSIQWGNIYSMVLAAVFFGIALNHYLPHYLFLVLGTFLFFRTVFNLKLPAESFCFLKSHYKIILLALVIFLLAASPFLFLYAEMKNYVSPTRGALAVRGAINVENTGLQPSVNAPLAGYRVFLDQVISYRENIHHAFYFGIVPLLVMPFALLKRRNKYLWIILGSSVVVLFLSAGCDFWGYRLLIRCVPGFNMLRHSFALAHFVSFFLICLSGYGFKELLCRDIKVRGIFKLMFLTVISLTLMLFISRKSNVVWFGCLALSVLVFWIIGGKLFPGKGMNFFRKGVPAIFFCLLLLDLTLFYTGNYKTYLLDRRPAVLSKIGYPLKRTFYPLVRYPMPLDLSPLIFKLSSLTHPDDNFILFRNVYLNDMLSFFPYNKEGAERALGVNTPLIYFTARERVFKDAVDKAEVISAVYEDSVSNPEPCKRTVFFLGKDMDFNLVDNEKGKLAELIEYTRTDNPNELELLVNAPEDGFLMRLENFHRGWQAFIDGKKIRVYRADYAFQAIEISKGRHKVCFRFSSMYPFLFYMHLVCVFGAWAGFNFLLFNITKVPNKKKA